MFFYVDCPDPSYIDSLLNVDVTSSQAGASKLHLIIHILGPRVWTDCRYQEWLKKYGSDIYVCFIFTYPLL